MPTEAPTEAPESDSLMYLGIILAVLGNMFISVALNIQKHSHNKNADSADKKSYLKRPMWWAGMLMLLFGELGNFLAYGMASAAVVAPLGTVALVTNALIAPFVLKEKFRTQDLIGIALAIGGAVVVVRLRCSSHCPISCWFSCAYMFLLCPLCSCLWLFCDRFGLPPSLLAISRLSSSLLSSRRRASSSTCASLLSSRA